MSRTSELLKKKQEGTLPFRSSADRPAETPAAAVSASTAGQPARSRTQTMLEKKGIKTASQSLGSAPTASTNKNTALERSGLDRDSFDSRVRANYANRDKQAANLKSAMNSAAARAGTAERKLSEIEKTYQAVRGADGKLTFPTQEGVDTYRAQLDQFNTELEEYQKSAEAYRHYYTAEGMMERMDALKAQMEAETENENAAVEASRSALLSDGSYDRYMKQAQDAAKRREEFQKQYDAIAKDYYYVENREKLETIGEDSAAGGKYEKAKDLESDLERVKKAIYDKTNYNTSTEAEENMAYLKEKYGLDESVFDYYSAYSPEPKRKGEITGLQQLRDEIEQRLEKQKDALETVGYNYDRLAGYEKMLADQEKYQEQMARWQEQAREHPVLSSAATVVMAPFQGIDYLKTALGGIGHSNLKDPENYVPANVYNMEATNFVNAVRGTISEELAQKTNWELFGQNVASFLYQTGMSVADSAAQVATLGSAATVFMGASAASSQAQNVIERGGTNRQAFWSGLAAGAAETLFEHFSVERLLKPKTVTGWKSLLKETAKQAGTEASEETFTEIANILSDAAIMGESSDFARAVAAYQEQGMTRDEAEKRSFLDCIGQVGWAAAGGALSGAAMGGGSSALNMAANARYNTFAEAVQAQIEGRDTETPEIEAPESTVIDTDPEVHTPEEQRVIREYQDAVDEGLVQFVETSLENRGQNKGRYDLKPVSDRAAADIQRITGVDTRGFRTVIEQRIAEHIVDRHGENGAQDSTMRDINDIGRMQYVLDNYDSMEPGGKSTAYTTVKTDGRTGQADTVNYIKAVNGTYYVVEAVPNTKAKTTYIVSAYMTNNTDSQHPVLANNGPTLTPESAGAGLPGRTVPQTADASAPAYTANTGNVNAVTETNVPQQGQEVNREGIPELDPAKQVRRLRQGAAEFGTNGRQALAQAYDGSVSAEELLDAFGAYYRAGLTGSDTRGLETSGNIRESVLDAAYEAGRRDAGTQNFNRNGGAENGAQRGTYGVSGEQADGGAGTRAAGLRGTVSESAEGRGGRNGLAVRARQRADEIADAEIAPVSTRALLGIERGSEAETLFEVPENMIRGDEELSRVRDEIAEHGKRAHLFAGIVTIEGLDQDVNGMVNGDDVFIKVDSTRYSPTEIWEHEKFHLLAREDPDLVRETMRELAERRGEEELLEIAETYLQNYAGAYGINLQEMPNWDDESLTMVIEEMLADAYAGKDTFRQGVGTYRGDVRELAEGRREDTARTRATPEGEAERYSISRTRNMPYGEQVSGYFRNDGSIRSSDSLYLGKSGTQLEENGINDAPLYIPTSVINKAIRPPKGSKSGHSLTQSDIAGLKESIENAPAIIHNPARNALIYITGMTAADGGHIVATFDLNNDLHGEIAHKATSIHSRTSVEGLLNNLGEDATVYVKNENELNAMLPGTGIQSPQLLAHVELIEDSVAQSATESNPQNQPGRFSLEESAEQIKSVENQNPTKDPDIRFSVEATEDGRPVAVVDDDILGGMDISTWDQTKKAQAKKAAKTALLAFKDGIKVGGIQYKVNKISRDEYTRSNDTERLYRTNRGAFADKMRAAGSAGDIITATTSWAADGKLAHPRNDNFVDFTHGEVLIQAGNNQYEAETVIGITDGGEYVFYDVVDMEPTSFTMQEGPPTAASGTNAVSAIQGDPSADSVTQSATESNPQNQPGRFSLEGSAEQRLEQELGNIFPNVSKTEMREALDDVKTQIFDLRPREIFERLYDAARTYDYSDADQEVQSAAADLKNRRVYVSPEVKAEFGDDWQKIRRRAFGKRLYFTDDINDIGLDTLNGEMALAHQGYFDPNETDLGQVVERIMDLFDRSAELREITLDEEAERYGGAEAVGKYREAYYQKFLDAANSYRDAQRGESAETIRQRRQEREEKRRELDDYVEQARRKLWARAEQGLSTPERTAVPTPEGMDIDEYTATLQQKAELARTARLRTVDREEFKGTDAMNRLGIRIEGSVANYHDADQLRKNHAAAESIRKEIRRAEKRLEATAKEREFASGVAAGIFTEEDVPEGSREKVMELADFYMAERAFGTDLLQQRRADINDRLGEQADYYFRDTDAAKVSGAFTLNNRTPERNILKIFGDQKGAEINRWLIDPVMRNEGERTRFVNRMLDQVRTFEDSKGKQSRLTRAERALTQMVIEGRAAAEMTAQSQMRAGIEQAAKAIQEGTDPNDAADQFKLDQRAKELAAKYAGWLEVQDQLESGKVDAVKVKNAADKFSDLYGQFYDAINDFLVVHGYEPIGFIKGYAPHMQTDETQGLLNRALKGMGLSDDVTNLPASIAGLTKNFRPNTPWNRFFQHRTGETTDYDVSQGFERYVEAMSDVLFHTDDIMRVRQTSNYFRRTYAQEDIREDLRQARELKNASTAEKRIFLQDHGATSRSSAMSKADVEKAVEDFMEKRYQDAKDLTKFSDFVVYLEDYANNLANKQVFADREMERTMGRTSLNIGNKLTRAFGRAQVAGNLSSALNQTAQLSQIMSELGVKYTAMAAKDNWNGMLNRGAWAQDSDFLTEKNGVKYLVSTPGEMVVDGLFKPLQFVDSLMSTLAVRGKYLQEINAGKSHQEAMRAADTYGRRVMGSRAKGGTPLAFGSKNIFNRMLHMFQLEALNSFEHVTQDIPRDFRAIEREKGRGKAAAAVAAVIVKMLLSAFILNRLDEELYGGTPVPFDILGLAANFMASGEGMTTNDFLRTVMDNGWERMTGNRLFGTDREDLEGDFDLGSAAEDTVYNVTNDIPYLRNAAALLGWGDQTLPMPDLYGAATDIAGAVTDEDAGVFSGEMAQALFGLATDILPAGRQIEKTAQGLETVARGGRYRGYGDDAKLQNPGPDSFWDVVRATMFGNSATNETSRFYASGDAALTAKQTALYDDLVDAGADGGMIYQAIQDWRQIGNDEELSSVETGELRRALINSLDLDDRQKLDLYEGLSGSESRTEDFRELLDRGMDLEEIFASYDKYAELNADESLKATEKATQFARWADTNLTAGRAKAVKEQFTYFSIVPASAEQYEGFTSAGMSADAAYQVTQALGDLEPEDGKTSVSSLQKCREIANMPLSESDKEFALENIMSEKAYERYMAARDAGISTDDYVFALELIQEETEERTGKAGTASQADVTAALDRTELTKEQKRAIWESYGWKKESPW